MINPFDIEEGDVILSGEGNTLTCISFDEWVVDFVDEEGGFHSIDNEDSVFWKAAEFEE